MLAACGVGGSSGNAEATKAAAPKAITYVKTASADAFDRAWQEWFDAAEKATGIKTTVVREPSAGFWDKRQQEYAGGTAPADFTYNQLNWFIVGGLRGMFVDHLPYYKRDKVDTSQFLKTEFESWMWKGKLWGTSFQTGGEGVMLNKQIFQEKGVPLPGPSWTYDDLIQLSQRLNDPAKSIAGAEIGQNGIQYMAGTFMRNFGGKVLNDARNKALYADDTGSVRGTEVNVDLHQKYKVTPTPQIAGLVPSGSSTFRAKMLAININYLAYVAALPDLGPGNIEVLPPPKGPTGLQTARIAGNAWSILSLSKAPESVVAGDQVDAEQGRHAQDDLLPDGHRLAGPALGRRRAGVDRPVQGHQHRLAQEGVGDRRPQPGGAAGGRGRHLDHERAAERRAGRQARPQGGADPVPECRQRALRPAPQRVGDVGNGPAHLM